MEVEALPDGNIALGNIYDFAAAGGTLRIGQGLKSDWARRASRPASRARTFRT
jgi:hypothetical protein